MMLVSLIKNDTGTLSPNGACIVRVAGWIRSGRWVRAVVLVESQLHGEDVWVEFVEGSSLPFVLSLGFNIPHLHNKILHRLPDLMVRTLDPPQWPHEVHRRHDAVATRRFSGAVVGLHLPEGVQRIVHVEVVCRKCQEARATLLSGRQLRTDSEWEVEQLLGFSGMIGITGPIVPNLFDQVSHAGITVAPLVPFLPAVSRLGLPRARPWWRSRHDFPFGDAPPRATNLDIQVQFEALRGARQPHGRFNFCQFQGDPIHRWDRHNHVIALLVRKLEFVAWVAPDNLGSRQIHWHAILVHLHVQLRVAFNRS
eukprot:Gregarina_sp_Pseudo_9__1254@NODE_1831_length_1303_cov_1342_469937_g1699_i0_p2_GENE_NODE_1831_length_1303_cov_1342_469937_g1699_i0NODE_1831_length_1303_cov_1342_469937_g1699_i0_p2_ORF_typecomplete_len310_score18_86Etmic2/PF06670_11/0_23_NODE_1831_length_1303_cov_1342_469937_g1699_i02851214